MTLDKALMLDSGEKWLLNPSFNKTRTPPPLKNVPPQPKIIPPNSDVTFLVVTGQATQATRPLGKSAPGKTFQVTFCMAPMEHNY